MDSRDEDAARRASRRRLLRSVALLSALGAAVVLGADGAARAEPPPSGTANLPDASSASNLRPEVPGDSITVEVDYFGMPQAIIGSKEEYFTLQSPAYFDDLMTEVVAKHPVISAMTHTMIASVNGVVGRPDAALKNGDVVDLVPATAGG